MRSLKDEGVAKLKEQMTQEALDTHMQQNHDPSEPKPTLEQSHAMIEQHTVEGTLPGAQV